MPPPLTPDNGTAPPRFRVGDLEVDIGKAEVTRGDERIALPKLSFDLLCALIKAAPAIVTNEELLQQVWSGLLVSPESVAQRVKLLRSAIGDDSQQPRYILGVRGRGYRLIPVPERLAESRPPTRDAVNPPVDKPSLTLAKAEGQGSATSPREMPGSRSLGPWKLVGITAAAVLAAIVVIAIGQRFWSSSKNAGQPATVAMVNKSIAVLPFVDMSESKDQEYFGDGMAEEIIDLLVRVPGLKVTSRTSSFQFKSKPQDLRSIAKELGVAYVLEGSVRRSGDRVRITAQLIDGRSGAPRWSQTYDRDFIDVLSLQEEISTKVVRLVSEDASFSEEVSRRTLRNPEAYSEYLQGAFALSMVEQPGIEQAVSHFQRALELDPNFADAAAALGDAYQALGSYGLMPAASASEKGRSAAQLALKLDPHHQHAHSVLSNIHITLDWDWPAAEREYQLGNPNASSQTHWLLSLIFGRWEDALNGLNVQRAADPLNPLTYFFLGMVQLRRGRLPEAEAALHRTLEINPTYIFAHYCLAVVRLARNEPEAALVEFSKERSDAARFAGFALTYFALGRKGESDGALAQLIKGYAIDFPSGVASVYAFRGESDEAFKWLDRAYAQKDTLLTGIKYRTEFDKLHDDPRYKALLKKMNLPE